MSSMFRSPNDDSSTSTSNVDVSDIDPVEDARSRQKGKSKIKGYDHANLPESGPLARTSSPIVQLPVLGSLQHNNLIFLSLLEDKCKVLALQSVNEGRAPVDRLKEDDDEVIALSRQMYDKMLLDTGNNFLLPREFTGPEASSVRSTVVSGIDDYFTASAAQILMNARGTSFNELSNRGDSLPGPGFQFRSIGGVIGSAPSLMFGEANSPFATRSAYMDEYNELCLLGKGGYGHVYRVRNHLDNQEYAIKKIVITSQRLQRSRDQDHIEGLLAEVRTLAKLNHTNIVRYYHGWIETGVPQGTALNPQPKLLTGAKSGETLSSSGISDTSDDRALSNDMNFEATSLNAPVPDQDDLGDGIEFGYSSKSQDVNVLAPRNRRESQATTSSTITFKTSILSVGEDTTDNDPEIETIPRLLPGVDHRTSDEVSSIQPAPRSSPYLGPDITLFIKMACFPFTLSAFLSSEPPKIDESDAIQHCFHRKTTIGFLLAILDGIEYLHSQRIVHRDLKPANIFLSVHTNQRPSLDGTVDIMACSECKIMDRNQHIYVTPCIGDFGLIAEIKDPIEASGSTTSTPPIFQPSHLAALNPRAVGTQFYRPPQMPAKEPVICPKLDVYSLGVIALELCCKFGTRSERATVLSNLNKGIVPDDVDPEMARGIKGMVCADRDKRWGCPQVRKWLEALHIL